MTTKIHHMLAQINMQYGRQKLCILEVQREGIGTPSRYDELKNLEYEKLKKIIKRFSGHKILQMKTVFYVTLSGNERNKTSEKRTETDIFFIKVLT